MLSGSGNRGDISPLIGSWIAGLIARLRGPGHRSGLLRQSTTGTFRRRSGDTEDEAAWLSRDRAEVLTDLSQWPAERRPPIVFLTAELG